jgi:hypothetical protein
MTHIPQPNKQSGGREGEPAMRQGGVENGIHRARSGRNPAMPKPISTRTSGLIVVAREFRESR